ncbi:hypothetical protein PAECIP111891_07037 [Paenibacillus allorhizoplanae]|uniref:DUF4303 domain-containing protein n=1 Tax=Paenibacillus allorhizoplanae TaxID=2905648 RepID=A0ABN8HAL8_9BACL|nr:DUF4303 domain-containing protein [Paenibacillus allorhizoplanae]CAH1232547.1 hypothetical protein PAECIP111891_07037 [Paenibacillus allorhizoplanae]
MNTYYSRLGRLLDEKTPIYQEGYYVMCEGDEAKFSIEKPEGVELITAEVFIRELVEGCKFVIQSFAEGPDNKNVYAFNLYSDEHNSYYIYMNTLDRFANTLERYRGGKYGDKYQEVSEVLSLKYNQGDFSFQFFPDDMGDSGRIIRAFESLAYSVMDLDEDDCLSEEDEPVIAFEAGILKDGFNLLTLKAVAHLIEENAFAPLQRTEDFIAFAATGNDYVDYSLTMRKTIDLDLFYRLFPDVKEKDALFQAEIDKTAGLTVSEALDYWLPAVHSDYVPESPAQYIKFEYDLFMRLECYSNSLARECLERMKKFDWNEPLERNDYELIAYYQEALHFAGELTEDQRENCIALAEQMTDSNEDLQEWANTLLAIART